MTPKFVLFYFAFVFHYKLDDKIRSKYITVEISLINQTPLGSHRIGVNKNVDRDSTIPAAAHPNSRMSMVPHAHTCG
jgi:hypothetical protein